MLQCLTYYFLLCLLRCLCKPQCFVRAPQESLSILLLMYLLDPRITVWDIQVKYEPCQAKISDLVASFDETWKEVIIKKKENGLKPDLCRLRLWNQGIPTCWKSLAFTLMRGAIDLRIHFGSLHFSKRVNVVILSNGNRLLSTWEVKRISITLLLESLLAFVCRLGTFLFLELLLKTMGYYVEYVCGNVSDRQQLIFNYLSKITHDVHTYLILG